MRATQAIGFWIVGVSAISALACGATRASDEGREGSGGGESAAATQPDATTRPATRPGAPPVRFFGLEDRADKVVFLIDASGSLIDTMPFALNELNQSIRALDERQEFNVIFMQGDKPFEVPVPERGLKRATPEVKAAVIDWMRLENGNVVPRGLSAATRGFTDALSLGPDAVFVLSDNITGRGRHAISADELIERVKKANQGGATINTIQYIYQDPVEDQGQRPTLLRLAEESGGAYKFLDAQELGDE